MQRIEGFSIILLALATIGNSLCIILNSRKIASLYRTAVHLSKSVRILSGMDDPT